MAETRSGGVYVGVYSKDEGVAAAFTRATASVQSFFNGVSAATARLGSQLAGVGAAISAPLSAATIGIDNILSAFRDTQSFSAFGSQLRDIMDRTGASAELLSTLGHAAKLTGGNMQSMGLSLFQMNRNIENGTRQVGKGLDMIGLKMEDVRSLSVDEKFAKITEAMAATGDAGIQAAAGQRIFGRAAKELMPMLSDAEGMKKMRDETERLGILWSGSMVDSADRLDDMMTRVRDAWQGIVLTIGAQLAPAFEKSALMMTNFIVNVRTLIRDNPVLFQTLNRVATALMGVGAGLLAVSAASKGLEYFFSPGGLIAVGIGLLALWIGALDGFLGDWKKLISEIQVGGQNLAAWFQSIATVVGDGMKLAGSYLDRALQDVLAKIMDWSSVLVSLAGRIVSTAVTMVQGIINGAIGGLNSLIGKVEEMLSSMMARQNKLVADHPWVAKALGISKMEDTQAAIPRIGNVDMSGAATKAMEMAQSAAKALQDAAAGRRDRSRSLSGDIGIGSQNLSASTAALQSQVKTAMAGVAEQIQGIINRITGKETPKEINSVVDLITGLFRGFDEVDKNMQKSRQAAPLKISSVGTFSGAEAASMFRAPTTIAEKQLAEAQKTNAKLDDLLENGGVTLEYGE